jgi:hypothetical protein
MELDQPLDLPQWTLDAAALATARVLATRTSPGPITDDERTEILRLARELGQAR